MWSNKVKKWCLRYLFAVSYFHWRKHSAFDFILPHTELAHKNSANRSQDPTIFGIYRSKEPRSSWPCIVNSWYSINQEADDFARNIQRINQNDASNESINLIQITNKKWNITFIIFSNYPGNSHVLLTTSQSCITLSAVRTN